MKPLSRRFYSRPTLQVAHDLIGRVLVGESEEGTVEGRIVEVEAYGGEDDPGSHAFRGRTRRNSTMFGPPGYLYVYFTYGMHYCANLVCERDGVPGAVLLRAVEPTEGLELMAVRRGSGDPRLLARGPARLCEAFGIDTSLDGADLAEGPVWIGGRRRVRGIVGTTPRVGVKVGHELAWRVYEEGSWASPSPRLPR